MSKKNKGMPTASFKSFFEPSWRFGIVTLFIIGLITIIVIGGKFAWTGFEGKELFDWLALAGGCSAFIIPLIVWLKNSFLKSRREKSKEDFEAYIKEIEAPLLKDQLSDRDKALVRKITLDTLVALDSQGKAEVLKFLYETKLIQVPRPAIDLSGADLKDIDLNRVDLSNSSLRGVNLSNAHLEYATLRNADLSEADLSYANLESTELSNANLAKVWARNVNLMMADLFGADLTEAVIIESDLSFIGLEGANLTGAFLGTLGSADGGRTNLYRAHLNNARMNMINLVNANLCGTDLSGASLIDADLRGADLQYARMINADLSGADLRGTNLEKASFENAICSFYLPLGTVQQQVAAIELELMQAGYAMTREEKAMLAQRAQTGSVVTPKQLAIKLRAIGIIVTEEQAAKILQARSVLNNTREFLIPGSIPYWKVKQVIRGVDRKGNRESEILENLRRNERLKGYLESRPGVSVEDFDENKIITPDAIILTTYSSRLDPRILRELQLHKCSQVFKGNKHIEATL